MFKVRTSKPSQWNKLYNNSNNGGISWCINGCPTDGVANVLANCVGYACSRFNEIYNELTGYDGIKYPQLCCNAEDFWTIAPTLGLERGQAPKEGAIMVWEGLGSAAGHVAIVERVDSANQVYTSESGYQSAYFWNSIRYKGNGDWGIGSGYKFLGFIYNPAVVEYKWIKKEVWFLTDGSGKVLTGWHEIEGEWYYMNAGGVMMTGWQCISGKWYYFRPTGQMLTGWQEIAGSWYYLQEQTEDKYVKGEMRTGWVFDKKYNGWFLLSNNGDMLVGWQKVDNFWYYLSQVHQGDVVVGEMWKGWLFYGNNYYYLDPTSGKMYTGKHTIDGKEYTFRADGTLIS